MIRGEKIYLTELDRANAEIIRGWLNDPEVQRIRLARRSVVTVRLAAGVQAWAPLAIRR